MDALFSIGQTALLSLTPRPLFAPLPHLHHRPYSVSIRTPLSTPPRLNLRRALEASTPFETDAGGGGGEGGKSSGGGSGGGGGDHGEGEGEENKDDGKMSSSAGLSMSQKLTLGYAALVGVGGAMGYLKSGSQKSLVAGGSSAMLLYFVHTQLPVHPVFASSLGLGLSAALLVVMGSRFRKSGKIFPAGVVSIVSLIMTGGYFHGILRSKHV